MTRYFEQRIQLTLDVNGTAHWQAMLATEFGGMSEMLQNLYGITNDPAHLRYVQQTHWGMPAYTPAGCFLVFAA